MLQWSRASLWPWNQIGRRQLMGAQEQVPEDTREQFEPTRMADDLWDKVMGYANGDGLPQVYDDFGDYLYDFWPDLPWNPDGQYKAIVHLLTKPTADFDLVREKLGRTKEGHDMLQELVGAKAIVEAQDGFPWPDGFKWGS